MTNVHHGVGIIVRNHAATRFYIQQKDAEYRLHPLAYSFFGGAVETGETPLDALARELAEELGAAAHPLLAGRPTLVSENYVGPTRFHFSLFEVVVDDTVLDALAHTPVFEGERGAVVGREQLCSLPFIWDLEQVARAYLDHHCAQSTQRDKT
jgi:8-oxo-dGTP pyrophosphatase MutT (NUDIX family)